MIDSQVKLFFATARERYLIKLRKDANAPLASGWSADEIFRNYRFCNVFREDDKVTRWMRSALTTPLGNDLVKQLRAAILFRWFNHIPTGELLAPYLLGYASWMEAMMAVSKRADEGQTILNGAYMIKSPPGRGKTAGIFECFMKIEGYDEEGMIALASDIMCGGTLERAVELLCQHDYIGPFMAYQMVCDLMHTNLLNNAADRYDWTSPGPGSARGISRVFEGSPDVFKYNNPGDRKALIKRMQLLQEQADNEFYWPKEWPRWELQTVQHWACEYDKYMRSWSGEGKPKQLYRG